MSVLGFDVDRCLLNPVGARCSASLSLDKDSYRRLFLNLSLVDEVEVRLEGFLKRQAQPESWVLRGGPWPSVVVPAATKRSLADPHTDMTAPWTSRLFMFSKTPVLFRPARSLEIRPQQIPTLLHRIMGSEDSPIVSYKVAQGIHWVHAHKCNAKPSKQISIFLSHRKNLNALQWCRRFSTVNWHSADSQALTTH